VKTEQENGATVSIGDVKVNSQGQLKGVTLTSDEWNAFSKRSSDIQAALR
jgi:hypothetical protein